LGEILDIGCGPDPQGTVNLDLFQSWSPHTKGTIDGRTIPNFIQGDAQYLPLRSHSFDLVYVSHLLEHLQDPDRGLRELARVSEAAVILVPNNPVTWEHPEHLYSWSKSSLRNLLLRYYSHVTVTATTRPKYPGKSRVYHLSRRFPIVGRWLSRVLLHILSLELIAYCRTPRTINTCPDHRTCGYSDSDAVICNEEPWNCPRRRSR